jgi:hypothetical protein
VSATEPLLVVHRGCMKLKIRFPNSNKITFTLYSGWSTGSPFLPSKTHQIEILKENRIFCCKFSFKIKKIVENICPLFSFGGGGGRRLSSQFCLLATILMVLYKWELNKAKSVLGCSPLWLHHNQGLFSFFFFKSYTVCNFENKRVALLFFNMSSPKAKSFNFFPYLNFFCSMYYYWCVNC